jgi:uncharacterized protein YjbI with pentapeptide repeats
MSGAIAPDVKGTDVTISDGKLDGIWWRMLTLQRAEITDTDLESADLYGAVLRDVRLLRCRLDGAELSAATLERVSLHGSTFDGLRGGAALRGITIDTTQIVPVAVHVFPTIGITVEDA